MPGGGRGTERVETRLEPVPSHADADRFGEVQGRVRLFPGDGLLTEPAERGQRLLTHPRVDEHFGALGVETGCLDRRLQIATAVDERGDHLRNRRHDAPATGGSQGEVRLALLEA